jgi:predicted metalloprotease with PDZ domain
MYKSILCATILFVCTVVCAQPKSGSIAFYISLNQQNQTFHVVMNIANVKQDTVLLKLPAWTPGYYQLLHFADNVSNFKAATMNRKELFSKRFQKNGWKVALPKEKSCIIEYDVKATRAFVATPFLDANRGYISPPGVYMHIAGLINSPASVTVDLPQGWKAATGLEPAGKSGNSFTATDFDVLYDSPILLGPLEELPPFTVQGIPHRFVGYNLGDFDRIAFMNDMKKVVEQAVKVIGHIPYKHYTFLAIGPGAGGIEHLNSTTFGFSGESMKTPEGKRRMYTFLAHEYFHHYNVKRIRPIELGPFDYDKENRTNMLWVSEGITVYYDLLITRRAGLMSDEDLFESYRGRLLGFENKPGRLYQSATQASYNTWSDGPFGRSTDEINKTVSVYDKGAILGLLLDFEIRNLTKNTKSLDDVMQTLYTEFYQDKKRGFKDEEFQEVCERMAGAKLTEIFNYASSTQEINYKKYFAYAGLEIENEPKPVSGGWLGLSTRVRNDSLFITNVDYESPAWNAGLRREMVLLNLNDVKPTGAESVYKDKQAGEQVTVQAYSKGKAQDYTITLGTKVEGSFIIKPMASLNESQQKIFNSWVTGD